MGTLLVLFTTLMAITGGRGKEMFNSSDDTHNPLPLLSSSRSGRSSSAIASSATDYFRAVIFDRTNMRLRRYARKPQICFHSTHAARSTNVLAMLGTESSPLRRSTRAFAVRFGTAIISPSLVRNAFKNTYPQDFPRPPQATAIVVPSHAGNR